MALSVRLRPIADSAWHYRHSPYNPALRKYTDRQKNTAFSHRTSQAGRNKTATRSPTFDKKSQVTENRSHSISQTIHFRKGMSCLAKGPVLPGKRACFARQKGMNCKTKVHLLQNIGNRLGPERQLLSTEPNRSESILGIIFRAFHGTFRPTSFACRHLVCHFSLP